MHKRITTAACILLFSANLATAQSQLQTSAGPLDVTLIADGLVEPWGVDLLPDGAFLITERDGVLKYFSGPGAEATSVGGLPQVLVDNQGGLLDVMIPADFAQTREVWLTFAKSQGYGLAGTAVGKGFLSADNGRLEKFTTLFEQTPPSDMSGGQHFGSRAVEAQDGTIFITFGDRGTGAAGHEAQNPRRTEGKVIHLNRDGTPATSLPGAVPGVYSIGHRNPQGATIAPDGRLLTVEHGPQGGDELNAPEAGKNYGWPVITHGRNYDGTPIGDSAKEGMEQPLHHWTPSMAPSGLMVYSGRLIPEWKGDIFFGSLNGAFLGRLDPDTPSEFGYAEERMNNDLTERVRDVLEAPDGSIWFLSVGKGALFRVAPAG